MPAQVAPPVALSQATTIAWVFLGILISVALPVAVRTLKRASGLERGGHKPTFGERLAAAWAAYGGNKYLSILVAAAVVAAAVVFLLGLTFYTARDAALAGFAWESLVSKVMGQPSQPQTQTQPQTS